MRDETDRWVLDCAAKTADDRSVASRALLCILCAGAEFKLPLPYRVCTAPLYG